MLSFLTLFLAVLPAAGFICPCFNGQNSFSSKKNLGWQSTPTKPKTTFQRPVTSLGKSLVCQIKYVDAVAEVLKRRFPGQNLDRVIDSWYKMENEEVFKERVEEYDTWQEANSHIRGLSVKAFYDAYDFTWARGLRDNAKIIQEEFQRVAIEGADDLETKGNNIWIGAANATSYAAYGGDWKTLALMDRCLWDDVNVKLFPQTTRILKELQVPCLEAFFARMTPRSQVGSHSDYCNFALTAHLGVDVPEGQCWIEVGNQRREWRNGEMLVFDTSLHHRAGNEADRMRYILMLRVFHPELSPMEVSAIRAIFSYLDSPELLDRDVLSLAPDLLRAPPPPAAAAAPPHGRKGKKAFRGKKAVPFGW